MTTHAPSPESKLVAEPHQGGRLSGTSSLIEFALGECFLGPVLVARSELGICSISLGDEPDALVRDLRKRFCTAESTEAEFKLQVAEVTDFIDAPWEDLDLPLDIRGTAFQQRVWELLKKIPAGQTLSYREVAQRLGTPKAIRAVAGACAANTLAVAIPCHRVVRSDGELSGYRWGLKGKKALLERERQFFNREQSA